MSIIGVGKVSLSHVGLWPNADDIKSKLQEYVEEQLQGALSTFEGIFANDTDDSGWATGWLATVFQGT